MVKPYIKVNLKLVWDGVTYQTTSEDDGFFKFEWTPANPLPAGWHPVKVHLDDPSSVIQPVEATGEFFIPYKYQYAFISDIDDTFLISHSSNLRKRLYVLFTKNARSRKPFEGVVNHYQLLASTGASRDTFNLFFYVSSSEWNLYDYLSEFFNYNRLPEGIFLLSQVKRIFQLLLTGKTKHEGKFIRIARILHVFPNQQFLLIGDNSQKDPVIYTTIAEKYPGRISAIYIRNVRPEKRSITSGLLAAVEPLGIHTCLFDHTSEARLHAQKTGLIE
jgi:phosphatidate phosphatase APP1